MDLRPADLGNVCHLKADLATHEHTELATRGTTPVVTLQGVLPDH